MTRNFKPRLGLGTAQFGLAYGITNSKGKIPPHECHQILDYALENESTVVDTATSYGDAAEVIGSYPQKAKLEIISKVSLAQGSYLQQLKSSPLGVGPFAAVLTHKSQEVMESPKVRLQELRKLQENGITKKIGASCYEVDEVEALYKIFPFEILQIPLNILDRRMMNVLPVLKDKGVEIHVRSVFLQGLLLNDDLNTLPEHLQDLRSSLERYFQELKTKKIEPVLACISFVCAMDFVDQIIVGVDSLKSFQHIVTAYRLADKNFQFPEIPVTNQQLLNPALWNQK